MQVEAELRVQSEGQRRAGAVRRCHLGSHPVGRRALLHEDELELELRHLRVRAVGQVDDEPAGRDAEDVREARVLNVGGDDGDRVDAEVVEGALREPGLGRGRVGAAREQEEREQGRALRRQIPVNRPKMEGKT